MAATPDTAFSFTGIGTHWSIITDGEPVAEDIRRNILDYIRIFNEKFSRFVPSSEVNSLRTAAAGEYTVSEEFARLLVRADELRKLTDGLYDPAVGELLELAGYDPEYRMLPRSDVKEFVLPHWTLRGRILRIDRGTVFDLGGMGKGYCIDRVAKLIEESGIRHYLVDGGGDMFGTSKENGDPWNIAIEYPGKPAMAVGTVKLKRQGLAVSDSFRRRWAGWHHIVHLHERTPIKAVVGAVAVAQSAWDADSVTSALFFAPEVQYAHIGQSFATRFLVFRADGTTVVSKDWEGELFV